MLRKLMSTIVEPLEAIYPSTFTRAESAPFEWLHAASPCFPVTSRNVAILTEPQQFYDTLLAGCAEAQRRITLVSLYLGTSKLEQAFVDALKSNKSGSLKINVLLDYTRASRNEKGSSRTMLLPLLRGETASNCKVSLYHTPALRGALRKLMPQRWNELLGLQHMKLYIFDNTLVMSGANLSKDYFTNRQDRYYVIKDKDLSDFYCGLVENVQKFSLRMDADNNVRLNDSWEWSPYEGDKREFVSRAGDMVKRYFENAKQEQNVCKREDYDTWVFPLVQMGQLGIVQDSQVTDRILVEASPGSRLKITTGYFNLTASHCDTLLEDCRANCDILMAHPKANGFFGVNGAAGGIPYAYSLIAQKFKRRIVERRQEHRIGLYEYLREGWTYHGKGLWYYPPNSELPCLTMIGSPNFGERSARKDLETQVVLITSNEDLMERMHEECEGLFRHGLPADVEREVPFWTRLFVLFCRNYF